MAQLNPDIRILYRAISLSRRALLVPLTFLVLGAIFFGALVYFAEERPAGLILILRVLRVTRYKLSYKLQH